MPPADSQPILRKLANKLSSCPGSAQRRRTAAGRLPRARSGGIRGERRHLAGHHSSSPRHCEAATGLGRVFDDAPEAIEKESPGLIDLFATILIQHANLNLSRHSATTPDGGGTGDIMVFRQESNPTTWRLAAMNTAKSLPRQSETATGGIDFDFGKEPAAPFTPNQHPNLRLSLQSTAAAEADFVMAQPSTAAGSLPRSHPANRPNGRIWLYSASETHRAISSAEFLVVISKESVSREFLSCPFSNDSFMKTFITIVRGTSGSDQRVKPNSLMSMSWAIPSSAAIQKLQRQLPLCSKKSKPISTNRERSLPCVTRSTPSN